MKIIVDDDLTNFSIKAFYAAKISLNSNKEIQLKALNIILFINYSPTMMILRMRIESN